MRYYLKYDNSEDELLINDFFIDSNLRNSKTEEKLVVRAFLKVNPEKIDECTNIRGFRFNKIDIYKEENNELVYTSSKWNTLADVSVYYRLDTDEVEVAYSYKFIEYLVEE